LMAKAVVVVTGSAVVKKVFAISDVPDPLLAVLVQLASRS
jgi:hypothetical protein